MGNQFGFIDIILLAMFAGFIILRLRNILGRKTGHQGKPASRYFPKGVEVLKDIEANEAIRQNNVVENAKKQLHARIVEPHQASNPKMAKTRFPGELAKFRSCPGKLSNIFPGNFGISEVARENVLYQFLGLKFDAVQQSARGRFWDGIF